MLRELLTTDDEIVWIDDRAVAAVYGKPNAVKVRLVSSESPNWLVKGTPREVALTLNGYYDE